MSRKPIQIERSLDEVQRVHREEAQELGWRVSFSEGSLPGDYSVSILPWNPADLKDVVPRYYLYRRDRLTGRFLLIKQP